MIRVQTSGYRRNRKEYIWGVQANLWAEWIPTMKRIEYLIVPRMIALSEIAWAEPTAKPDLEEFYRQLVPQFKRMDVMRVNYRVPDLQGFYKVNAFIDETTVELTCPLPGTEIRLYDRRQYAYQRISSL